MAAQLSLASANVTRDGEPPEKIAHEAQVLIRGNVLTVRGASGDFAAVSSVEQTSQGVWTVRLVDGMTITVERGARRCCGRR